MKQRVFIVHGWDDSPEGSWFPWLKGELLKHGREPHVLEMPKPEWPQIDSWVHTLKAAVGTPDNHTFFVGHSIGCQTILRYLENIPDAVKIGGMVLVAGWLTLKPAALEEESAKAVADPWLHRPIHWTRIKAHLGQAVLIASDNDPYVSLDDQHFLRDQLQAQLIVERSQEHLSGSDGVTILPSVLKSLLMMGTDT